MSNSGLSPMRMPCINAEGWGSNREENSEVGLMANKNKSNFLS